MNMKIKVFYKLSIGSIVDHFFYWSFKQLFYSALIKKVDSKILQTGKKILNNFDFIGCVLQYIKTCRLLFNAKSCLILYIKHIWFVNEKFVGNIILKLTWAH